MKRFLKRAGTEVLWGIIVLAICSIGAAIMALFLFGEMQFFTWLGR